MIQFINKENEMWYIDRETKLCRIIYLCNHEEADTRMIADAAITLGTNYIVLSAYDSDIFFLGVYDCALNTSRHWRIEYKSECYIDLQGIAKTLGKFDVPLPTFHAMTGCDTSSYFHFKGKVTPWKKMLNNPHWLSLIDKLGEEKELSENAIQNCIEFVKLVVYGAKTDEALVQTKIRMYLAQKKKHYSNLPPNPNSYNQDILRKHLQAYILKRCVDPWIEPLDPLDCGWKRNEHAFFVPLW